MKKAVRILAAIIACISMCNVFTACNGGAIKQFYNTLCESQILLDRCGDMIYACWYDYIYTDEFGFTDVDNAVNFAQAMNSADLDQLKIYDEEIAKLYKKIAGSKYGSAAKDALEKYSKYYEFVVNVSGSFNNFSTNLNIIKNEFTSALKFLSYEVA